MISICMNDRQPVITNVLAGASICQEISMYLSYFSYYYCFFSSLKNYYCIFLVLIYFLK